MVYVIYGVILRKCKSTIVNLQIVFNDINICIGCYSSSTSIRRLCNRNESERHQGRIFQAAITWDPPIFPKLASSRGMTQIDFLKRFFPEDAFLERSSHNVFLGTGTQSAQRSRIFNDSLPDNKTGNNLCQTIVHDVFDSELWAEMVYVCKSTCNEGVTDDSREQLEQYLDSCIEDLQALLTSEQVSYLQSLSLIERTEAVVFLFLMKALRIDANQVERLLTIIAETDTAHAPSPILSYDSYHRYIQFGRYPQTVADRQTATALKAVTPVDGIYSLHDQQYVRLTANLHTDYNIYSGDFTFANGDPIQDGQEYFFRIEPIHWRILDETDDHYLILSDRILDHILFNNTIKRTAFYFAGNRLANNWEDSTLFNWLNQDLPGYFLHDAFSQEERDQIPQMQISNLSPWKENDYTSQKVFPLSYDEAMKYLFNFNEEELAMQQRRAVNGDTDLKPCLDAIAFMTDYAVCRGVCPCDLGSYLSYFESYAYVTNESTPSVESIWQILQNQGRMKADEILKAGTWWLRSPGNPDARFPDFDLPIDYTRRVCDIMEDGHLCQRGSNVDGGRFEHGRRPEACDGTRNGVRPALYLPKHL